MDGTVLNTLGDLTDAMNYAFKEAGYRAVFSEADTKQFFGSGVEVAIKRALAIINGASFESLVKVGTKDEKLPEGITEEEVTRISKIYRPYYDSHCDIKTGPYEGIPEAIKELRKNNILTAVVSNKPDAAVQKLVHDDFEGLFDFSLGEKHGIKRKPAPDMVNFSLQELLKNASDKLLNDLFSEQKININEIRNNSDDNVLCDIFSEDKMNIDEFRNVLSTSSVISAELISIVKQQAVYIGDSEIDIETAKNSGLDCIGVDWGFRSHEFLINHGAGLIVKSPEEMAEKIMSYSLT